MRVPVAAAMRVRIDLVGQGGGVCLVVKVLVDAWSARPNPRLARQAGVTSAEHTYLLLPIYYLIYYQTGQ